VSNLPGERASADAIGATKARRIATMSYVIDKKVQTSEKREARITQAGELLAAALAESHERGWYGRIKLSFDIHDGGIQFVKIGTNRHFR
jgi:hypothetical protein